jgi:hypothetical protein
MVARRVQARPWHRRYKVGGTSSHDPRELTWVNGWHLVWMPAADVAFSYGHGDPEHRSSPFAHIRRQFRNTLEDLGVAEIPKGTGQTYLA